MNELLNVAKQAKRKAKAPYSGFHVGAAVLCEDGTIYMGANIEADNAAVSLCAERSAISNAIVYGNSNPIAIAISSDSEQEIMPCGNCRQFLTEFPGIRIVTRKNDGSIRTLTPNQLLPLPYKRRKP